MMNDERVRKHVAAAATRDLRTDVGPFPWGWGVSQQFAIFNPTLLKQRCHSGQMKNPEKLDGNF